MNFHRNYSTGYISDILRSVSQPIPEVLIITMKRANDNAKMTETSKSRIPKKYQSRSTAFIRHQKKEKQGTNTVKLRWFERQFF